MQVMKLLTINTDNDDGGYSSAWLERTPDKGEVAGSSPASPTFPMFSPSCVFSLLLC